MSRLPAVLALLAVCCLPASGLSAASPGACAGELSIDISTLTPFLNTLPPDEKDEQLRDWALYGVKSALAPGAPEEMPIRHPALTASHPGEVSPGRVFSISAKEWGIIVPPELLGNKPLLGGLIDRKYETCNLLPEKVSLFTYSANAVASAIGVSCQGSVPAAELFTPAYGYYSATVGSLPDLSNFASRVDDLVSFSWHSGRLTLGGRKYLQHSERSLTVEDIAALYQAYNPPVSSRKEADRIVRERYAELLAGDTKLQKALRRGTIKKSQVLARLRRQLSPARAEPNVGFSLDPQLDYAALAGDLRRMTGPHSAALRTMNASLAAGLSAHRTEIEAAARRLESRHDLGPLLSLRRHYENSPNPGDLNFADTLRYLETKNAYQTARYEGNLQGTGVGMILFYTDLLAKLWALDYHGMAPKASIKGFRTMQEIPVPKLNWSDFVRLSKTRLWFGLRGEGFDAYGDKLLFQPAVTRVYAASSDPLHPGKESAPNYQSGAFLGWWDRHYEAVAAVEPYYHKLDQIQKWGCVLLVLKENRSPLLGFLRYYPVAHDLDFADWTRSNPVLARIGIPFLDRHRYGRSTECLPLLRSGDYQQMGKVYVLSGGVSLASRKDILAKLHKRRPRGTGPADELPVAHAAGSGASGAGPAQRRDFAGDRATGGTPAREAFGGSAGKDGKMASAGRKGKRSAASSGRTAGEGKTAGLGEASVPGAGRQTPGGGYGTFSAEKKPGALKLKWEKGPSIAMHELVASLAALQQANYGLNRGEAIFGGVGDLRSVVRVKQWSAYLVKTGAGNNQWMYLGVNPAQLADYPAQAAAAFPEADIFCAKLVSDTYARKLAAGKPVLR